MYEAEPQASASIYLPAANQVRRLQFQTLASYGGEVAAVVPVGNVAVVGAGTGLFAFDVSDPTKPRLIGQSPPFQGQVVDVAVDGGLAYVLVDGMGSDGVRWPFTRNDHVAVVAINDPSQLRVLGEHDLPSGWPRANHEGIAVSGDRAFVIARAGGPRFFRMLDISDPANVNDLGLIPWPGEREVTDVTASGGHLYATDGDEESSAGGGLWVFHVTESGLDLSAVLSFPGSAMRVAVDDRLAVVASVSPGDDVELGGPDGVPNIWFIDVSQPSAPRVATGVDAPVGVGVAVAGPRVATLSWQGVLTSFDVTDPFAPRMVAHGPLPGGEQVDVVGLVGDSAVAFDSGLATYAVAAGEVRRVGSVAFPTRANRAVLVGNRLAVVGDYGSDVHVIDVSNPRAPRPRAILRVDDWVVDIAPLGNERDLAVLSRSALQTFDLSVDGPVPSNTIPTEGSRLYWSGQELFVSTWDAIAVYRWQPPGSLELQTSIAFGGEVTAMTSGPHNLYVAGRYSTLTAFRRAEATGETQGTDETLVLSCAQKRNGEMG